ncbi:MAG TPA: PDDEXK nuclease domain-containing protein [Lacibacter sp.]|nr:PDDEXK nuclease domain-containing protein [Lacibacter sp.]HMO89845.1 PDDEXK nuclease domain-containing protein [Lacibacter sp.]
MSKEVSTGQSYKQLLVSIKQQVQSAQAKAALAVNSSLIQLYWNMGKMIAENQSLFEGRSNYVEQLAKDLRAEFPEMTGFSRSNLFYIRKFYRFYSSDSVQQAVGLNEALPENSTVQQPAAPNIEHSVQQAVGPGFDLFVVPWGQHVVLLDKTKSVEEAFFYLKQTIENNWSRAILTLQIEQDLYSRQGKAITNFHQTLPEKQALMAGQILKDPYNFSFLTLEAQAQELDVERQLTEHITKFLLELGKGFAFIGRQYPLQVGDKDYRLDLLFYHIRLRCFVVIDLKVVEFEPEFAGKMNFYLSAVDDLIKTNDDQPSIGIILCKNKNKLEVEYALRGMSKPIGVSEFTVTQALPAELKSTLPTVEEFENELNKDQE